MAKEGNALHVSLPMGKYIESILVQCTENVHRSRPVCFLYRSVTLCILLPRAMTFVGISDTYISFDSLKCPEIGSDFLRLYDVSKVSLFHKKISAMSNDFDSCKTMVFTEIVDIVVLSTRHVKQSLSITLYV